METRKLCPIDNCGECKGPADNYEWYKPKNMGLYISIMKYRIGISAGLFEAMGKPKYVQLGHKGKLVAIKPLPDSHAEYNEYALRISGGKTPRINSKGFIRILISEDINIEGKARKYLVEEKENIFCAEL